MRGAILFSFLSFILFASVCEESYRLVKDANRTLGKVTAADRFSCSEIYLAAEKVIDLGFEAEEDCLYEKRRLSKIIDMETVAGVWIRKTKECQRRERNESRLYQ